jgi:YidC/Oxa1 family membrane protein insertase
MPLKQPIRLLHSLRIFLLISLFVVLVPLTGCGPLAPPPPVSNTVEEAFKAGETKEAAARAAEEAGNKSEAARLWNDTAIYYGAVAQKFAGSDNGLKAVMEQVEALEKSAGNPMAAQLQFKNALKQYNSTTAPETYPNAQAAYEAMIQRIDKQNSESIQYKVMDFLVHLFGNNPAYSPIIAILAIAVIVTVVLWPLRVKQYQNMKEMQRYMPELQKLQARYKEDPQKFMEKRQAFMREHGVNEFAGCLPMLLQLPVTWFMYMVILNYQFRFSNTHFLWMTPSLGEVSAKWPFPFAHAIAHNLGEPDLLLLIVYAISMYLQTKLMPTTTPTDPVQAEQQKMMTVMMPIIFFVMMLQWQIASAFVLYWFASNVLGLVQQQIIYRTLPELPPLVVKGEDSSDSPATSSGTVGTNGTENKSNRATKRLVSQKSRRRIKR